MPVEPLYRIDHVEPLHRIDNPELGIATVVFRAARGFAVRLLDVDSGLFAGPIRTYPALADALVYARRAADLPPA